MFEFHSSLLVCRICEVVHIWHRLLWFCHSKDDVIQMKDAFSKSSKRKKILAYLFANRVEAGLNSWHKPVPRLQTPTASQYLWDKHISFFFLLSKRWRIGGGHQYYRFRSTKLGVNFRLNQQAVSFDIPYYNLLLQNREKKKVQKNKKNQFFSNILKLQ